MSRDVFDGAEAAPVPLDHGAVWSRALELVTGNLAELAPAAALLFMLVLMSSGVGAAMGVLQASDPDMEMVATGVNAGMSLLQALVALVVQLGLTRMFLSLNRGEEAGSAQIFEQPEQIPRALLAGLLLSVGVLVGLCLGILPAIFVLYLSMLVFVLLVDTDLAILELFKRSSELLAVDQTFTFLQFIAMGLVGMAISCGSCGFASPLWTVFSASITVVLYDALRANEI
ncbi:MAG: hypothetical protein H6734_24690 [Alphaproteobacteria bacterium]|nr:hypothetical protein [Alphaproteobacteria bacterium]